jgi:hypothetical protein
MSTLNPLATLSVEDQTLTIDAQVLPSDALREMKGLLQQDDAASLLFTDIQLQHTEALLHVYTGYYYWPKTKFTSKVRLLLFDREEDRHCLCQFDVPQDPDSNFDAWVKAYLPDEGPNPVNLDLQFHPFELLFSSLTITRDLQEFFLPHLPQSELLNGSVSRGLNCSLQAFIPDSLSEDYKPLSTMEEDFSSFFEELLGPDAVSIPSQLSRFHGCFHLEDDLIQLQLDAGITGNWSANPIHLEHFSLGPNFLLAPVPTYPEIVVRGDLRFGNSNLSAVPSGIFSFHGSLHPHWKHFELQLKLGKDQSQPHQLPFSDESGWKVLLDMIPIHSVEMGVFGSVSTGEVQGLEWKIQGKTFQVIEDRLRITPSLNLALQSPFDAKKRTLEAELQGIAEIGADLKLQCTATYPDTSLQLELMEPVTSSSLAQLFFEDIALPGPLQFELETLSMSYEVQSGNYAFQVKVGSEHWKYAIGDFEMALTDLELSVQKDAEIQEYSLSAYTKIQDTDLLVSGSYRKGAGWDLSAHTDGKIQLNEWLKSLSRGQAELPGSLAQATISYLRFYYQTGTGNLEIEAELLDPLETSFVSLNKLQLAYTRKEQTKLDLLAETTIMDLDFAVEMKYQSAAPEETDATSNWSVEGRLPDTDGSGKVSVNKVIEWLEQKTEFSVPLPDILKNTELKNVFFRVQAPDDTFSMGGQCHFPLEGLEGMIDLEFVVGKTEIQLAGTLSLQNENGEPFIFRLRFDKDPNAHFFLAQYQGHLTLQKIVGLFNTDAANDIPAWLSPSLDDVSFVLYKGKEAAKWAMLMKIDMNLSSGDGIDLSQLDFIGPHLPAGKESKLKVAVSFTYSSEQIKKDDPIIERVNELEPPLSWPNEERDAGPSITPEITLPFLNLKKEDSEGWTKDKKEAKKTNWKPVRKQVGPVFVDKIGLTLEHGRIRILLDAGIDVGGFTFKMLDFGISLPLRKLDINTLKELRLELNGLELNLQKGDILIAGGFYKQELTIDNAKIQGTYTGYVGEIRVMLGSKSLSAMGGYVRLDKTPSFFLFAVAQLPLGGPPEFFIEGLAGGFGINSNVQLPAINQVRNFVIVKSAFGQPYFEGDNQSSNLSRAFSDFEPTPESYWIAVGVKASHYKFLESFLLAIVSFGDRLEVSILGIARMNLPGAAKKMAKAELQLRAQLIPEEGVFMVEGKISEGSYIFNPMAKLSGEFAFYSWFTDQKDKSGKVIIPAGDFVMTLGGYSPYFQKPDHYPAVDRLAVTYRVSDSLFVKAEAYFALTPRQFMLGGRLKGVFETDLVSANLVVEAHFLVNFEPFSYFIRAGINLSGEFWALWWHSFEIGVNITLWGPDFGGIAVIDLGIFDFKIKFGKPLQPSRPIDWKQFQRTLLPPEPEINKIFVSEGIILENKADQYSAEQVHYLVSPTALELHLESGIPAFEWSLNGKQKETVKKDKWEIGIASMNVSEEAFRPRLRVSIEQVHFDEEKEEWIFIPISEFVEPTPIRKAVPAGLWGKYNDKNINGPTLLGTTDETAPFTGIKLRFQAQPEGRSEEAKESELKEPEFSMYPLRRDPIKTATQEVDQAFKKKTQLEVYQSSGASSPDLSGLSAFKHLEKLKHPWSPGKEKDPEILQQILDQYEDPPYISTLGARKKMVEPKKMY